MKNKQVSVMGLLPLSASLQSDLQSAAALLGKADGAGA